MNKVLPMLAVVLGLTLLAGAAWAGAEFKNEQEKQSYAIGANVARRLKQQGVTVDTALLAKGLNDEFAGKSRLSAAEIDTVLQALQQEVRERLAAEQKKSAGENRKRGVAYLGDYAKQEGVQSLGGGILYKVLQAGSGAKPGDDDNVLCNYRGRLVDGKVFDASPAGKPASFEVAQLIPGWREALKAMSVGSKWEIVIPAEMAYGEQGVSPSIGPNETLIFELELVGIE